MPAKRMGGFVTAIVFLSLALAYSLVMQLIGVITAMLAGNALDLLSQSMLFNALVFDLVAVLIQFRAPYGTRRFAGVGIMWAVFYHLLMLFLVDFSNTYVVLSTLMPTAILSAMSVSATVGDHPVKAKVTAFLALGCAILMPVAMSFLGTELARVNYVTAMLMRFIGEFLFAIGAVCAAFSVRYLPLGAGTDTPEAGRPAHAPSRPDTEALVMSRNLNARAARTPATPAPARIAGRYVNPEQASGIMLTVPADTPSAPMTVAEAQAQRARREAALAAEQAARPAAVPAPPAETPSAPAAETPPAAPETAPAVPAISLEKKKAEPADPPAGETGTPADMFGSIELTAPTLDLEAEAKTVTEAPLLDHTAAPLPEATPVPELETEHTPKVYTESPVLDAPERGETSPGDDPTAV